MPEITSQSFMSSPISDVPPLGITDTQPPPCGTVTAAPRDISSRSGYLNQILHTEEEARDTWSSVVQPTPVLPPDRPTPNGANAETPRKGKLLPPEQPRAREEDKDSALESKTEEG